VSLKYRIAVIIFLLEAILVTTVLSTILQQNLASNTNQANINEQVLLNVLSDLSRIALFTAEYDELQPYIEEVINNPQVINIMLLNSDNRVVVSSTVSKIGNLSPELIDSDSRFWRVQEISNAAGLLGKLAINFSHDPLLKANRAALDTGVTIALTGMVFIAFVGIGIGFLLTRRLEKLKQTAQQFATGDLTVRTNLSGRDEVAIVGQSFDHMATEIEHNIAELRLRETELRNAHSHLEKRIEERTAELAIARDQALEYSRAKSNFLANMSHELRTPLNAIIGYSEMLSDDADALGYSEFSPDLEKIRASGAHLLSLINDVLDLSKIEAGKTELNIEKVDIHLLVEHIQTTINPIISKSDNTFTKTFGEGIDLIYTDALKLSQSLINLIGNASKFTAHGEIRLEISAFQKNQQDWVQFSVIDTGIGITEEQIGRLFIEFSQADSSTTRKYGGTGLGLTISKRYCKLLGGDLTVKSEPNKGSEFTILLPNSLHHIVSRDRSA